MLTFTLVPWIEAPGVGYKITRQSTNDDAPLYLSPARRDFAEASFDPAFGFMWGSELEAITFILYVVRPKPPYQVIVSSYERKTCDVQRAGE
jgi:hypothetical protein